MIYIKKKKWVKNYHIDKIEKRCQHGFFRCPRCNEWIGIYNDEFSETGRSYRGIRCSKSACNFFDSVKLLDW